VPPDFDRLVDSTDLTPADRARLLRVHELLVGAGPPAELPAAIGRPPAPPAASGGERGDGTVVTLPARRRTAAALLVAAAVAAACFAGGYVLANQAHKTASIDVIRVVPMQGEQNSQASLRVGTADGNGNWPIQLTVNGLKPLQDDSLYYLIVWQDGKPVAVCGTFEVSPDGPTTVNFNVAYRITDSTKWVVTRMAPGARYPGHVVMTTA
jgi:hypothetical protein